MPDEEQPQPSEPSEEEAMTGPTVMKPPPRREGAPAESMAPRLPSRAQPTFIDTSAGSGRARNHGRAVGRSGSDAPRVSSPTAITGVERKRIDVSLDDLKALSPGAETDTLERALRLLQAYVAEDASDRTAILWGQRLQQDYADLVSATLARSQADVLTRVTAHLNRMMEILRSIDLVAVAGTTQGGRWNKYLKKMSKNIDTPKELQAACRELDQLVKLMNEAMDGLLDLRVELEQSSSRIDDVGSEVEAAALGAQFLSNYLQSDDAEISQLFLERSMSLTQTAVQIRGSVSMRESQIEQPLRLISAIQNVVLVMVPAWLGSITSLTVLAGRAPTPTEAGEMAFQLRKILEQMQA
jgi:hypothetical protein